MKDLVWLLVSIALGFATVAVALLGFPGRAMLLGTAMFIVILVAVDNHSQTD